MSEKIKDIRIKIFPLLLSSVILASSKFFVVVLE